MVLLSKSIADPENKEEFKKSVNDWDEVLRAFGQVTQESAAAPDVAQAQAAIPNLLMRLKAERV